MAMALAEKRANRVAREAQKARMFAVRAALADEMTRFNQVAYQVLPVLHTAFGDYYVRSVNSEFWYMTQASKTRSDSFSDRSFCGCNDGKWEDLLKQCGLSRHPLFQN